MCPVGRLTTSWDDGHPNDLRVAELLTKFGLTGTFYIPRESEHGVMCDSDVRQIAGSFEVGAHTVDHVDLTTLDDHESSIQMKDSKAWLEGITGRHCAVFCAPRGRFDRRHLTIASDTGFVGFRTTELLSTAYPVAECGLKVLPTTVQAYPHRAKTYLKNCVKRGSLTGLMRIVRPRTHREWTLLSQELAFQATREGGVFHLWGHSWEIDELNLWDELEDVFRLLAVLAGSAPCVTNQELCEVSR